MFFANKIIINTGSKSAYIPQARHLYCHSFAGFLISTQVVLVYLQAIGKKRIVTKVCSITPHVDAMETTATWQEEHENWPAHRNTHRCHSTNTYTAAGICVFGRAV